MRKVLLLLMGIFLLAWNASADVISFKSTETGITGTNSSNNDQVRTFTKDGVTFGVNYFNQKDGQIKVNATLAGAFTFYNTTAIDHLQEVRITTDVATVGTLYMKVGETQISGNVSTSDIKGVSTKGTSGTVTTFTVPGGVNASYFKIQVQTKGSGTVKSTLFEIEYGTKQEQTEAPVISGTTPFSESTTVSITNNAADPDATIYYALNGAEILQDDAHKYNEPFTVSSSTQVSAIAISEGKLVSAAVSKVFLKTLGEVYTPVTSASQLTENAKYVIAIPAAAGADFGNAVSNAKVANGELIPTWAIIDNNELTPTDATMFFSLVPGNTAGTWQIKSDNYAGNTEAYYYNVSSSITSTDVSMSTTSEDFNISFDADNNVQIASVSQPERHLVFKTDCFKNYKEAGNVKLYVYDTREQWEAPIVNINSTHELIGHKISVTITQQNNEESYYVRYTTNGTDPSETVGTLYDGEFKVIVKEGLNIKAVTYGYNKRPSKVAENPITVIPMPELPTITWTYNGTEQSAEYAGEYEVPEGTELTITAVKGNKVRITDSDNNVNTYTSPYTLTLNEDMLFTAVSYNDEFADALSEEMTVGFTVKRVKRYKLVNNVSQLVPGAKYIIAAKQNNVAVSTESVSTWLGSTPASADNNVIIGTDEMMVFRLQNCTVNGSYQLVSNNFNKTTSDYYLTPSNDKDVDMKTSPSDVYISFNGDNVKIAYSALATKYLALNTSVSPVKFRMYDAQQPVQLYLDVAPIAPAVTYSVGDEKVAIENEATATVINSTTVTLTSPNATSFVVNENEVPATDGVATFTIDVDEAYFVQAKNEYGLSDEFAFGINVNYEADNIVDALLLSEKQKDRTDKDQNAPVTFTDWVKVTGHYVANNFTATEYVWVEDNKGACSYLFGHEHGNALPDWTKPDGSPMSPERGIMLRNFVVRSSVVETNTSEMLLVSWPGNIADDVQSCDLPAVNKEEEGIGLNNCYKLVMLNGKAEFTTSEGNEEATLTLSNNNMVRIINALKVKEDTPAESPVRFAESTFNWLPGQAWPTGTYENIYIAGFVMPYGDDYALFAAQATDTEGEITGVNGVDSDAEYVSVSNGIINAPEGSRIYALNGTQRTAGIALPAGIYVVVLPNGNALKVVVK